jgi:hypothetical protein
VKAGSVVERRPAGLCLQRQHRADRQLREGELVRVGAGGSQCRGKRRLPLEEALQAEHAGCLQPLQAAEQCRVTRQHGANLPIGGQITLPARFSDGEVEQLLLGDRGIEVAPVEHQRRGGRILSTLFRPARRFAKRLRLRPGCCCRKQEHQAGKQRPCHGINLGGVDPVCRQLAAWSIHGAIAGTLA